MAPGDDPHCYTPKQPAKRLSSNGSFLTVVRYGDIVIVPRLPSQAHQEHHKVRNLWESRGFMTNADTAREIHGQT